MSPEPSSTNRSCVSVLSYDKGIPLVDGSVSLIKSDEFSYIKPSFQNNYSGGVKEGTPTTRTTVFGLVVPATFEEMFGVATRKKLTEIALTEHQIVAFIRTHRTWMYNWGRTHYFPFEYRNHVNIAAIFPMSDHKFGADVYIASDATRWGAPPHNQCLIVPRG